MFNQFARRFALIASLAFFAISAPFSVAADMDKKVPMASEMIEKININTADVTQLSKIKGIGEKKAQAIIDYREANGSFKTIEDLVNVKGIGDSTLQKLKPYLSL